MRRLPDLILDISRVISRASEAVPTGIDRVELAYAEYLIAHHFDRLRFIALHPLGTTGLMQPDAAAGFIQLLSARWNGEKKDDPGPLRAARRLLQRQIMLSNDHGGLLSGWRSRAHNSALYLLLSHHHLTRPAVISRILTRHNALFVPMVHDLIPSDYPEYARPREPARHALRIKTVAEMASSILVPSDVVRQRLLPYLHAAGRGHVPINTVHHGVTYTDIADAQPAVTGAPYFVCLGTIEPRKNHLLLLNIWRRLAEIHGERTPKLVLIGRRGWENENILDMIERCPILKGVVTEHNALPDLDVVRLLKGARALLMPSFAEGYGLPAAEALALDVPVICSDIPIFHEIGQDIPEYLDPLDGIGWLRMIERYTIGRPARTNNRTWIPTGWNDSIRAALTCLEPLLSGAPTVANA